MWHFEEDFYDAAGDYEWIINFDWHNDDIKSDSKTKLCFHFRQNIFLNIFSGLRHGFSFEWNFNISLPNQQSFILFKKEQALEKFIGKYKTRQPI